MDKSKQEEPRTLSLACHQNPTSLFLSEFHYVYCTPSSVSCLFYFWPLRHCAPVTTLWKQNRIPRKRMCLLSEPTWLCVGDNGWANYRFLPMTVSSSVYWDILENYGSFWVTITFLVCIKRLFNRASIVAQWVKPSPLMLAFLIYLQCELES